MNRKDNKGQCLRKGEQQRKDNGMYIYRYTDSCGRRQEARSMNLAKLRVKEKQIQKDLDDNIFTDSNIKNLTLNTMFEQYMSTKILAETTRINYENVWKNRVKDEIGNIKIVNIRPSHVKSFYTKLSKAGYSYSTIKLIHNLIYPTLEMAVDDDIIRKNPSKKALDANYGKEMESKISLTLEQQERFFDFIGNREVYKIYTPMFLILNELGLRCGELIGLTWDDVDMVNKVVSINHQLIYKNYGDGYKFHISHPKTNAGNRDIPMTEAVLEAFREQEKLNSLLERHCKDDIDGYDNFVFISNNNRPYMPACINSIIKNIVNAYNKEEVKAAKTQHRKAELLPEFSVHTFRHTACTNKARQNMNVKVLQRIMGHSSSLITMDTYNHLDNIEDIRNEVLRCERNKAI